MIWCIHGQYRYDVNVCMRCKHGKHEHLKDTNKTLRMEYRFIWITDTGTIQKIGKVKIEI